MYCSKCGNQNNADIYFCRQCGNNLERAENITNRNLTLMNIRNESLTTIQTKDPDELTGKGVSNVIIGDGFFMVAVILSATHSPVSSLLWLILLIPAFFFFGKGFTDVFRARQIRRRIKKEELKSALKNAELPPASVSFVETIKKHTSGELLPVPSVTDNTTRELK